MPRFLAAVALSLALTVSSVSGVTPLGTPGGTLVVAQTSEPKTLNPLTATDLPTRDVLSVMLADLVHINRRTLQPELALARRCEASPDGRHYTITLRDGLRFSDGAPLTADDVVFTFAVYADARVNSPQRDLLMINGRPIQAVKLAPLTVRFDLPALYAPGERLFDSFWILPKHKLERAYTEGTFAQAWTTGSPVEAFATAGPFRLQRYLAGQRVVFERNPYYWKRDESGSPLPYLEKLEIEFVADQNAQLLRLLTREVSVAGRLRSDDVSRIAQEPFLSVRDAGAGFEYNFLFFNWDASSAPGTWFRSLPFRRAVAHAIDRDAIVRLVYHGLGAPLSSQVTPGNTLWRADNLTDYRYDPARAAALLREAGFRRSEAGPLLDPGGRPVEFSLMVSASNQPRRKMATLIQEDLAKIGIAVRVEPTEFGVLLDTVLKTRRFDAAIWGIASEDADPNAEMNVWATGGTLHVWKMPASTGGAAFEPWEQEVSRLMGVQMVSPAFAARKAAYDKVQQLVTANLPMIFLASPHVLAAADRGLGNFEPATLNPVVLWNADRLFWRRPQ